MNVFSAMILRGTSTRGIPLPFPAAQSASLLPPSSPVRLVRRRRGTGRRLTGVELSDVANIGSDDVIIAGKHSAFGCNDPWAPSDIEDDVIFCCKVYMELSKLSLVFRVN